MKIHLERRKGTIFILPRSQTSIPESIIFPTTVRGTDLLKIRAEFHSFYRESVPALHKTSYDCSLFLFFFSYPAQTASYSSTILHCLTPLQVEQPELIPHRCFFLGMWQFFLLLSWFCSKHAFLGSCSGTHLVPKVSCSCIAVSQLTIQGIKWRLAIPQKCRIFT